jgi:hypothetical protein
MFAYSLFQMIPVSIKANREIGDDPYLLPEKNRFFYHLGKSVS